MAGGVDRASRGVAAAAGGLARKRATEGPRRRASSGPGAGAEAMGTVAAGDACKSRARRWRTIPPGRRGATPEEHTAERPSQMRISNAVFCLKNNNSPLYESAQRQQ